MYPPTHLLEADSADDFGASAPQQIELVSQPVEIPAWLVEPAPEEIRRIAAG